MINLFTYNSTNKYKDTIKKINTTQDKLKNESDQFLQKQTIKLQNEIKNSDINKQNIKI